MKKYFTLILALAICANIASAKVVISENFDKFTEGTESSPVAISDFDAVTQQPGWSGISVNQAGGCAFISAGGQISTPSVDLSGNSGNYAITFRAKSDTPGAFYLIMDSNSGFSSGYISSEWEQYTIALSSGSGISGGSNNTLICFSAYCDMLIDDIVVDDSGIGIPQALPASNFTRDGFNVNWLETQNAKSYLINVFTLDYNVSTTVFSRRYIVQDKEVTGTTYRVTEGQYDMPYYYTISAKSGDAVSQPSSVITVAPTADDVKPVVAQEATGASADKFTAHWTTSELATQYYLHTVKHHTATADGIYTITDTDFSEIESTGTIDAPQRELEWLFDGDWMSNMPLLAKGMIGINNQDINLFGQAFLQSPALDLSACGGTVKVSFTAFSRQGLKNAMVRLTDNNSSIGFVDTQEFTVTEDPETYTFTLTQGSKSSYIVITSEEPGRMFIDNLKVSVELPEGASMITPIRTMITPGTSAEVTNLRAEDADRIAYYVRASWAVRHDAGAVRQIPEIFSDPSNVVWVDRGTSSIDETADAASQAKVSATNGGVNVMNPLCATVEIYNTSGQRMIVDNNPDVTAFYTLPPAIYVVKIGNATFKVSVSR